MNACAETARHAALAVMCAKAPCHDSSLAMSRKAQEAGEYGEAILMCLQTFQGLESLKSLKVRQACATKDLRDSAHSAHLLLYACHDNGPRCARICEALSRGRLWTPYNAWMRPSPCYVESLTPCVTARRATHLLTKQPLL